MAEKTKQARLDAGLILLRRVYELLCEIGERLKRKAHERRVLEACGCVCYCPQCREIMNDIGACEEIEDGVYRYTCPCGFRPVFDFVLAPVPLYRGNP